MMMIELIDRNGDAILINVAMVVFIEQYETRSEDPKSRILLNTAAEITSVILSGTVKDVSDKIQKAVQQMGRQNAIMAGVPRQ